MNSTVAFLMVGYAAMLAVAWWAATRSDRP